MCTRALCTYLRGHTHAHTHLQRLCQAAGSREAPHVQTRIKSFQPQTTPPQRQRWWRRSRPRRRRAAVRVTEDGGGCAAAPATPATARTAAAATAAARAAAAVSAEGAVDGLGSQRPVQQGAGRACGGAYNVTPGVPVSTSTSQQAEE
mgnify:CR=1 FL=1